MTSVSNAPRIDSLGSRSRRKRMAASTPRAGSAPSLAQRAASPAGTVTRWRVSLRESRTATSKVKRREGSGRTMTDGGFGFAFDMAASRSIFLDADPLLIRITLARRKSDGENPFEFGDLRFG